MFFFQAEDGIRDLVRSRGLGDVYKRQHEPHPAAQRRPLEEPAEPQRGGFWSGEHTDALHRHRRCRCLLYTSDAADERSSVDLGGRRIIQKKKKKKEKKKKHMNKQEEVPEQEMTKRHHTHMRHVRDTDE